MTVNVVKSYCDICHKVIEMIDSDPDAGIESEYLGRTLSIAISNRPHASMDLCKVHLRFFLDMWNGFAERSFKSMPP